MLSCSIIITHYRLISGDYERFQCQRNHKLMILLLYHAFELCGLTNQTIVDDFDLLYVDLIIDWYVLTTLLWFDLFYIDVLSNVYLDIVALRKNRLFLLPLLQQLQENNYIIC